MIMTEIELQQMHENSTNLQNYVFELESKVEHTKTVGQNFAPF